MMKRIRRAAPAAVLALATLTLSLASCGAGHVKPEKADAQLAFGIKMAKRGLWSEALFRFRQAERHEPGNPRMLNNLAVAYEALGQFDLALDYYQRALKASPADGDLRRNYSRFVEFYRNFRAETAGEGEEGGAKAGDAKAGEAKTGEDGP